MTDFLRVDWYGCYDGSWQSAPLVAEAYAHPAKVSFGLAGRIYRHMLAEGWLSPGNAVLDPFGGIGGFAFHAALYGMHWTGVELEQKFVDLGGQNLALWRNRYAPHFPGYGSARLLQGDSRRLVDVVTGAGGVVSSPPYADGAQHTGGETRMTSGQGGPIAFVDYGHTPGQLGAMPAGAVVSSPPFSPAGSQMTGGHQGTRDYYAETGRRPEEAMSDGNLGAMQAGAVISSPPYSETRIDGNGDEGASGLRDEDGKYLRGAEGWQRRKAMGARYGGDPANLGNMPAGVVSSPPYAQRTVHGQAGVTPEGFAEPGRVGANSHVWTMDDYGSTAGNLGNMPAGVVSSPPYASNVNQGDAANDSKARRERKASAGVDMDNAANVGGPNSVLNREQSYGSSPGQLGNNTGDTFWSAAAIIVQQCYDILQPGGYAAWVTGDFVRNKKRVPFGEQWLALCESVGFVPILWATAWKSESHGEQLDIFGNGHNQGTTKVSFFRRLANQKSPDTAIVNEDVIFVRKPAR